MSKTKNSWRDELRVIELIEQSIFLVRSTFPSFGWIYYLSTIPFIIALIYFWSIMSSKLIMPFEISRFALLLTLLFWIKVTGQSIYCKQLLAKLIDEKPNNTLAYFANIAVNSIFVQPFALIILIISFILVFPLGYALIFSQYLFIASTEQGISIVRTLKTSYKFAIEESFYQHLVLFFLIGLSIFIFLNVVLILFFFPQILKTFFNIDTVFTQSAFSILNTTFILITACTSYLIFDPIFKGFYANLYFHVKSRSSGEDIMAECRRLSLKRGLKKVLTSILLVFVLFLYCPHYVRAHENHEKNIIEQQIQVEVEHDHIKRLAQAILEISKGNLYRWKYRNNKDKKKKKKKSFILQMIEDLLKTIGNWLKPVGKLIEKVMDRVGDFIRKWLSPEDRNTGKTTEPFWSDLWPKLVTILTVFIFLLGVIYLFWQHHKDKITVVRTKKKKLPDLMEEDIDVTELKEDEWLKLKETLKKKGDLTLALRSAFLAILSFFHKHNYIIFERYKTNYNYLYEVESKYHNKKDLVDRFRLCIEIFERSWYGKYPVDIEILERFEEYQQGIIGKIHVP